MDVTAANKHTVITGFGVNPTREMKGSFNEEKFTVVVPDSNGERREVVRDLEEKENSEPLIFNVVAKAELAVEVRERGRRGGGEGKREGFMLPDVRGGVRRNEVKDLEVEVEGLRGSGGIREGRGVREDSVVNSVVWDPGVCLRLVSHFDHLGRREINEALDRRGR